MGFLDVGFGGQAEGTAVLDCDDSCDGRVLLRRDHGADVGWHGI
jgi:hypothetical protein